MPPSETESDAAVVADAPAALLAAGDNNNLPSNDNPSIPPNDPTINKCRTKNLSSNGEDNNLNGGANNGVMEGKEGESMPPAAADESVAKTDNENGSVVHDALHPTNNNSISEKNNDTPTSSPRRRVKKQRSDDFIYEDTKKDEKPSISENGAKKPPPPAKKPPPRKRPQQCPSSDSILIEVPLSVTADLGVALKRTRRKRIKRIQDWVASAPGKKQKGDNNKAAAKKKSESPTKDANGKGGGDSCSDSDNLDDDGDNGEKDITLDYDDDACLGKTPKRNQYVSVVDYLEAKYVRGVMIADYDDREQAKIQSNDVQEEPDSEGDNSCYDDEDGFIDDSLIVEDVAGQVMASSTYGLTQIEEEARRRKQERKKESGIDVDTEQPTLEGLGITDEKLDDTHLDEGMESDFDDGFFVNLGDLEMAEGWSGDNVVISPTKKKRTKKRVKAAAKDDKSSKKKTLPSSPQKKKKPGDTKQKTDSKTTSPKKGKKTPSGKSEDKQPKKKDQVVKQPKKMSPEKERAAQLRKLMKRKYNICVKMIKDMTTDQLPLKQRNKKTVKLSVNIPPDKTIGDEITFANPNVPGKKYKILVCRHMFCCTFLCY
jgi:hypothetical protein